MDLGASILVQRLVGDERSRRPRIEGDIVRLDLGDPDFSTPSHICEAAGKAMRDGFTHYSSPGGYPALKEAVCARLWEDEGVEKNPNQVLITHGAAEAIFLSMASLLSPGDEVLVLNPSYSLYGTVAKLLGVIPIPVPYASGFRVCPESVEARITPRTKMLIINNPCNPTAQVYTDKEVRSLADVAIRKQLIVVADEVYHAIIYDGRKHHSISRIEEIEDRAILVDSLSKTYAMTGWRLGWAIGPASWIGWMKTIQEAVNVVMNSISQRAAISALTGPQECVTGMREIYTKKKILMQEEAASIGGCRCLPAEGTFYVFLQYDYPMKAVEMARYLLNNGVSVRSGTEFGSLGEGYIRLSYTSSEEAITEGMARIRRAFGKLPAHS